MDQAKHAAGRAGGLSRSEKKLAAFARNRKKGGRPSTLELTVDVVGRKEAVFSQAGVRHVLKNVTPSSMGGELWKVEAQVGTLPLTWVGELPGYPAPGRYRLPYQARNAKAVVFHHQDSPAFLRPEEFVHHAFTWNPNERFWIPRHLIVEGGEPGQRDGETRRGFVEWSKRQQEETRGCGWSMEREMATHKDPGAVEGTSEAVEAVRRRFGAFAAEVLSAWLFYDPMGRSGFAPPASIWQPFAEKRMEKLVGGFEP